MHSSNVECPPALITLSDVSLVRDGRPILAGVNMHINAGDVMAVTGPNGGGKTSLLRIILRLLSPTTGMVTYTDRQGAVTDRLKVGYLPQKNAVDSRFPVSVGEVVESALLGMRVSADECRERAHQALTTVEMAERARQPIGQLSGGQLQRVLLARAIISRPEVLVLDEPLSYLDRHFESRLLDILQAEVDRHTTILLVSHQISAIDRLANRHIIVGDGRVELCHAHSHYAAPIECD